MQVKITFRDGSVKEFYADQSYQSYNEGRLVYWEDKESGKGITYPVDLIAEIIEKE